MIIPMPCKITAIPIMELVRFICKEHHGNPHKCSKCHPTIDFKFM
jgi:hypothetical protein